MRECNFVVGPDGATLWTGHGMPHNHAFPDGSKLFIWSESGMVEFPHFFLLRPELDAVPGAVREAPVVTMPGWIELTAATTPPSRVLVQLSQVEDFLESPASKSQGVPLTVVSYRGGRETVVLDTYDQVLSKLFQAQIKLRGQF